VTSALGRDIAAGARPAGTALPTEDEACLKFGVSRSVVREAVRQLASKGMLTTHRRGGTRVTDRRFWNFLDADILSWTQEVGGIGDFLDKLFELRMALEPTAAALTARLPNRDAATELRGAYEAMVRAKVDFDAWVDADLRFHQAIYLGTGNELFWPVGQLFADALRASFRVSSSNLHHQHCLPEHEAVLLAIEQKNPNGARRATEILLHGAEQDIEAVLRSARLSKAPDTSRLEKHKSVTGRLSDAGSGVDESGRRSAAYLNMPAPRRRRIGPQ
jgi:DNA-binding FadR family transcriptional regulator